MPSGDPALTFRDLAGLRVDPMPVLDVPLPFEGGSLLVDSPLGSPQPGHQYNFKWSHSGVKVNHMCMHLSRDLQTLVGTYRDLQGLTATCG